jgi:hypothetical protein
MPNRPGFPISRADSAILRMSKCLKLTEARVHSFLDKGNLAVHDCPGKTIANR